MLNRIGWVTCLIGLAVVWGCGSGDGDSPDPSEPDAGAKAERIPEDEWARIDLSQGQPPEGFVTAVATVTSATGRVAQESEAVPGAKLFRLSHDEADDFLIDLGPRLQKMGFVFIRYQNRFGGGPDTLLVLPTGSRTEAVHAVGTAGPKHDVSPGDVATFLKALHRDHPFYLIDLRPNGVSGVFVNDLDADAALDVARRSAEIAPDFVNQGAGSLDAAAAEIEQTNRLTLWWD